MSPCSGAACPSPAAGGSDEVLRRRAKPPATFRIATANVNSVSTFFREEVRGGVEAQACLLQELSVDGQAATALKAQLKQLGWRTVLSPSTRTVAGGLSAGTAVVMRGHLRHLPERDAISRGGRAAAAMANPR